MTVNSGAAAQSAPAPAQPRLARLLRLSRRAWLVAAVGGLSALLLPLALHQARGNHRLAVAELAGIVAVLGLSAAGARALRMPRPFAVLFASGIALRLAYLFVTPSSLRTHDVDEHVAYVQYIVEHHGLPDPTAGWAFYHPPLYFALGAVLWWTVKLVGVTAQETILRSLQCQSIAYQAGFLAFSLLAGDRWLDRSPEARLGPGATRWRLPLLFAALMCFWPSAVMHSVRIGNDDLFYLFFGGGLYFVTLWWQGSRDRDLHLAAACAALSTLTKSNGVLLFVLLALLLGTRALGDRDRSLRVYLRRTWPAALALLVSAGATLGKSAVGVLTGKRHHVLVENADLITDKLAVGNLAANYVWFDTKMFVIQPYADVWKDGAGRQFFWNHLLKTSLLGEFQFDGPALSDLGVLLSCTFLAMLAVGIAGVVVRSRTDRMTELPLLLVIGISTVSLAALRMSIPKICSNDFRYILPVLMPALCLYVRSLARLRESGKVTLARWGEGAGWSFAGLSVAFIAVLASRG